MNKTDTEIDELLNEFLACDSKYTMLKFMQKIGDDNPNKARRLLWGIAFGAREYAPTTRRIWREGPLTAAETQVLMWAVGTDSREATARLDSKRLSLVLARPEEDIARWLFEYGPARKRKPLLEM